MGQNITPIEPNGAGQTAKATNQIVVACDKSFDHSALVRALERLGKYLIV
jgi:3-hydroxyisobutyrate dehydrogenase-like beta-hydroxyacid dehydrogenase